MVILFPCDERSKKLENKQRTNYTQGTGWLTGLDLKSLIETGDKNG